MIWEDDEQAEGVLAPLDREPMLFDSQATFLGFPDGAGMLEINKKHMSDQVASKAVHDIFDAIGAALDVAVRHNKGCRLNLDHLSQDELDLLLDALGSGEVTMLIHGGAGDEGEAQIQETTLPGVWIGRVTEADGSPATWLEIADAPFALRKVAMERPVKRIDMKTIEAPHGAMNVLGILAEIDERSTHWTPGEETHVMNFTLFPMTPADSAFLSSTLGETGVQIMSGGYGVARVIMTAVPHVWAVQFLNGMGTTILDTVEVGDIPSCVLASVEDFEDSRMRLTHIQEAYRDHSDSSVGADA